MASTDTTIDLRGAVNAPALSFCGVDMTYPDGTHALADIDLDVRAGEFVTVVGPSGCGKSTLLKIASGLLDHTGGEVEVDRERLGYVFQDATLLPWRTVAKNVELLCELHGIDRTEIGIGATWGCGSAFQQAGTRLRAKAARPAAGYPRRPRGRA